MGLKLIFFISNNSNASFLNSMINTSYVYDFGSAKRIVSKKLPCAINGRY